MFANYSVFVFNKELVIEKKINAKVNFLRSAVEGTDLNSRIFLK